MPHMELVIQVIVAVLLGGLIGLEREVHDKPAGFRTIILICVGACVFTQVSRLIGGPEGESTRIAAQIVTGIGFLGAGSILRERASVMGMTTAATIWAVAAIGMTVGFGQLGLAIVGAGTIMAALLVFNVIEQKIGDMRDLQEYALAVKNSEEAVDRVVSLFQEVNLDIRKRFYHQDGSSLVFFIVAMGAKADHERLRRTIVRSTEFTLRSA